MNLNEYSIEIISKMITGDMEGFPYRSKNDLHRFFENLWNEDNHVVDNVSSRFVYTVFCVENLKDSRKEIIKKLLHPKRFSDNGHSIEDAVMLLNEYLRYDGYEVVPDELCYKVVELPSNIIKLEAQTKINHTLTQENINEHIKKCEEKLKKSDYSGAITNARSLVEAVLLVIAEDHKSPIVKQDGDINAYYKHVKKLLNLEPNRTDIADSLREILSSLFGIINGLSAVRNKMSDSHGTIYRPDHHHAKLAVNAAMTFVDFIFSTRDYQQKRSKDNSKKDAVQ